MKTGISLILLLSSLVIIIAVLLQESKTDGVASLTGETNIAGKGGKKSKDAVLSRVTIVSAIVFFISSILLAVIK